jgi:V/A-type H+/Na+-transporting ATPase subunit F
VNCMPDKRTVIGAVGERDAVLALRAVGMRVIPAATAEEVSSALFRLAGDGVPVIFITESAARRVPEMLERYAGDPLVTIIPIPGTQGSDGYGMERVRANVIRAVGADLLLSKDMEE